MTSGAVFLSYASEDANAASRICEALRTAGVEVWFDRNELRGGDAWDSQIKKQIHDCALFMPLISAHTNARLEGYFRGEWKLATQRLFNMAHDAAFLVPVVIDETRESNARVPEEFFRAQWTWLPGGEAPPTFAKRVRQLLGMDLASVPSAKATTTGVVEPITRSRGSVRRRGAPIMRRFGIPLIALLLALGGGLFWYYQSVNDAPTAKLELATAAPAVPAAPDNNSIAVLPFKDMSAEKNQEYMADGIAEELLNLLAQAPELKVIARTSSFAFKDQNIDIAEIARKLNVAHVLEGSVRTSGNRLRITVQLIRAADSSHLWSEKYDRPLDDIFAVQDEIAKAVAQALQIRLAGGTVTRRQGGTENLEAYRLYLRAVDATNQNTKESLEAAEEYAKAAIKLDPHYGGAWDVLSSVASLQAQNGFLPATEGFERARQLAQRALELSPDLADSIVMLGDIHALYDWDWAAAEADFQRALAIDPRNYWALNSWGRLNSTLGRWEEAELQLRAAQVRDPLEPFVMLNLGHLYYFAGRFEDSERTYRKLLELEPNFPWTRGYLGKTLLLQGKPEAALTMVQQETDESVRLAYLAIVLLKLDRQSEAEEALKLLMKDWADTGAFYVAKVYAYRGDHDLALEWLERAYRQKDATLIEIVGEHLFKGMADDPRYKAFLRKMNLPV